MNLVATLILMVIRLSTGSEPACHHEDPTEQLRKNNRVFLGYLESIENSKPDNLGNHWTFLNFRVCDIWNGPNEEEIRITVSSIDKFAWAPFQRGECYLVFARDVGGRVYLHRCSQTKPFRFALFERYRYSKPVYSSRLSNWGDIAASELVMSAMSQNTPENALNYMEFKSTKQDSAVMDSLLVRIASGSLDGDSDRAIKALCVVRGLYDWVRRSGDAKRRTVIPTTQVITNKEFLGTVNDYGNRELIFDYRLRGELGPTPESEAVIQLLMIRFLVKTFEPPNGATMCVSIRKDGMAADPSDQFLSALNDLDLKLVPRRQFHKGHYSMKSTDLACAIDGVRWRAVHLAHVTGRIRDQYMSTTAVWRDGEWYLLNSETVTEGGGYGH